MGSNRRPMVSICIPVFNQSGYIKDAVESALRQSYGNKEVIVVDNDSTDDTWEAARRYQDQEGVRVFRNTENIGMAGNWNRCVEYSRGEYVKFIFGDDILYDECLNRLMEMAESDRDAALIFSGRDFLLSGLDSTRATIGNIGYHMAVSRAQRFLPEGRIAGKDLLNAMFPTCVNLVGEPSSALIRKDVLQDVGLFDPSFSQLVDVDMWIRILKKHDAVHVKLPLCAYRIHGGMTTETSRAERSIVPDLFMIYFKHQEDLKGMLDRVKYKRFAWSIFMNTVVYGKLGDRFPDGDLRKVMRSSFLAQGGPVGLLANTTRYLFDRMMTFRGSAV